MAIMKRGSNVALTREVRGLTSLVIGIDWDAGSERALGENLVVATILCNERSKALSNEHFVYFNQLSSPDESVQQRDAALGSDNEQIEVDLADVPAEISRIVIVMYLNEGLAVRRTLGQLRSCVIRVLNANGNAELVRSENLAPALAGENAVTLGEVYRYQGDWKFKVVGDGYSTGVLGLAADYGVTL
jgi:tellurium resistance protein TerD